MKILLMGMAKLKYMPYIHFYLNKININDHEVHISYWDRDGKEDCAVDERIQLHCFRRDLNDSDSMKRKLPCFLKYRKHLKRVIKEVRPDVLIVHYQTTGVLIYDYLTKKYKGKYILDYRDVTYERISLFKKMVARLVDCSYATFISSDGFRKFLPESKKIYNSHNLIKADLENREAYLTKESSDKIRIAFWGLIRHASINKIIIERLANDERFELHYYGRAQGQMLEILNASVKQYGNVFFHGEYLSEQRRDFARVTDIIHNIYDNNDKTMPIAMANKFYDGPVFVRPQLCARGSLMGDLCSKYGIGLACDPRDEDFADKIYNYYQSLNVDAFIEASDAFLEDVITDVEHEERIVASFFADERK